MDYPFIPWSNLHDAGYETVDIDDWTAARAYYDWTGGLHGFTDNFVGNYRGWDEDEAIGNFFEEVDYHDFPAEIRPYINWNKMGRDARLEGSMFAIRVGVDEYAVFYNN